jgi:hypothetical protein
MHQIEAGQPNQQCKCRIDEGQIVYCALHKNAAGLLAACQYVRKVLPNCVPEEDRHADEIRHVVLPYLDKMIEEAEKEV